MCTLHRRRQWRWTVTQPLLLHCKLQILSSAPLPGDGDSSTTVAVTMALVATSSPSTASPPLSFSISLPLSLSHFFVKEKKRRKKKENKEERKRKKRKGIGGRSNFNPHLHYAPSLGHFKLISLHLQYLGLFSIVPQKPHMLLLRNFSSKVEETQNQMSE